MQKNFNGLFMCLKCFQRANQHNDDVLMNDEKFFALKNKIKDQAIKNNNESKVRFTKSGCLGACENQKISFLRVKGVVGENENPLIELKHLNISEMKTETEQCIQISEMMFNS